MAQTFLGCVVFLCVYVVSTALQLSEIYDCEKWLYPLPANLVSLLPQGRQRRSFKNYSLLGGSPEDLYLLWSLKKKAWLGVQGSSPL